MVGDCVISFLHLHVSVILFYFIFVQGANIYLKGTNLRKQQ